MHYSLIDWIDSAKTKRKLTFRRISWINSQGSLGAAIERARRNGTHSFVTATHLILFHTDQLTIEIPELSVLVVHGLGVTLRKQTPPEEAVVRLPIAKRATQMPIRFGRCQKPD